MSGAGLRRSALGPCLSGPVVAAKSWRGDDGRGEVMDYWRVVAARNASFCVSVGVG